MTRYKGERIFLDELPIGYGHYQTEEEVQCGAFCEMADDKFKNNIIQNSEDNR